MNFKKFWRNFWNWYEKHYVLTVGISGGLFLLQLIHLYWLTVHVVFHKIFGVSLWDPSPIIESILVIVDYTEIPALIGTSLIYINELRKGAQRVKNTLYLIFLNSQFLHIFWITDEFVEAKFTGAPVATILPLWLAIVAIAIDYLELPVMFETFKKFFEAIGKKKLKKFFIEDFGKD